MGVACLGLWGVADTWKGCCTLLLLQSALVRAADVWYTGGSQHAWHRLKGVAAARGRAVGDG